MSNEPVIMVSETETSAPMPIQAWAATQRARVQADIAAQLDAENVPADHALRAEAVRLVNEYVDRVNALDLQKLKIEHERTQWRAHRR